LSLNNNTYIELTSYLNKNDKNKLKKLKDEILDTSSIASDECVSNTNSEKNMSKKLRFTNTESHIINRVKYEKQLKENESCLNIV
jgi:hypothetical protein